MPNTSQLVTQIILQVKIETKREIREMGNPIPILQYAHKVKEESLAMIIMVSRNKENSNPRHLFYLKDDFQEARNYTTITFQNLRSSFL